MASGQTTFEYATFSEKYNNIKNAVGTMQDTDATTIGGVINSSNITLANDLEYAEDSSWAFSKMEAWNEMYPSLKASFDKCVNLLDVAKATADEYNAMEQRNIGIRQ